MIHHKIFIFMVIGLAVTQFSGNVQAGGKESKEGNKDSPSVSRESSVKPPESSFDPEIGEILETFEVPESVGSVPSSPKVSSPESFSAPPLLLPSDPVASVPSSPKLLSPTPLSPVTPSSEATLPDLTLPAVSDVREPPISPKGAHTGSVQNRISQIESKVVRPAPGSVKDKISRIEAKSKVPKRQRPLKKGGKK
ncbi:verprolin-like [Contarinia nasturtii]|uniref:verprolin-like n=1 Tax=Contarinia nasturtii TaxID=265458 RepID=UPI0012D45C73|nr:verprolin-like [Contarinia nasturtii]